MLRALFRLGFSLTILFSLLIGAICAAAYTDLGMTARLIPSGCAPPCLMGVRPGAMSGEDAIRALVRLNYTDRTLMAVSSSYVTWMWNGLQPTALRAGGNNPNSLEIASGTVVGVQIPTAYRLGDVLFSLGTPDLLTFSRGVLFSNGRHVGISVRTVWTYADLRLQATALTLCPVHASDYWQSPVTFSTVNHAAIAALQTTDPLHYPILAC